MLSIFILVYYLVFLPLIKMHYFNMYQTPPPVHSPCPLEQLLRSLNFTGMNSTYGNTSFRTVVSQPPPLPPPMPPPVPQFQPHPMHWQNQMAYQSQMQMPNYMQAPNYMQMPPAMPPVMPPAMGPVMPTQMQMMPVIIALMRSNNGSDTQYESTTTTTTTQSNINISNRRKLEIALAMMALPSNPEGGPIVFVGSNGLNSGSNEKSNKRNQHLRSKNKIYDEDRSGSDFSIS